MKVFYEILFVIFLSDDLYMYMIISLSHFLWCGILFELSQIDTKFPHRWFVEVPTGVYNSVRIMEHKSSNLLPKPPWIFGSLRELYFPEQLSFLRVLFDQFSIHTVEKIYKKYSNKILWNGL